MRRSAAIIRVSARLAKALTLLVSGECSTQLESCAAAKITPRALQLALKTPNVRAYMQEQIVASLGISAMKAAKRIDELLRSSNEMVAYHASRYALATGAQVLMPAASQTAIQVNIGAPVAGYCIYLAEGDEVGDNRITNPLATGSAADSRVIEGELAPVADVDPVRR